MSSQMELGVRVVVLPEVVGCGLRDECSRLLLNLWRDGHLRWVVSRWLLVRNLRLLNRLGVPPEVLQWWGWWLSDPKRTLMVEDDEAGGEPWQRCARLAGRGQASAVIHAGHHAKPSSEPMVGDVPWASVADFMAAWPAQKASWTAAPVEGAGSTTSNAPG